MYVGRGVCVCVCMHACMYVCMYVCMHVLYVCRKREAHTHKDTYTSKLPRFDKLRLTTVTAFKKPNYNGGK